MRTYLIFHYNIEEQDYIEAYPYSSNDLVIGSSNTGMLIPQILSYAFISSPSRTEARRCGYKNWINSSGVGFNQLPYRYFAKEK
tara:strand:+ start:328 stop:579 length:252 start_codon:yes stop_codon:yes gene_type:complete